MGNFQQIAWLSGIISGDGYIDDRHIDIFNSSPSILSTVLKCIKQTFPNTNIRVEIYNERQSRNLINKWMKVLDTKNVRIIPNTSPWKSNKERLRIRVASKEMASQINQIIVNWKNMSLEEKASFLKGLFDAEGSVDLKGYIEFKQANNKKGTKIFEIAVEITKEFGIEITKPNTKRDSNKTNFYFCVKNLEKFSELIGFVDEEKNDRLNKIISILKTRKAITEKDIEKSLTDGRKTHEQIMLILNAPYYNVRTGLKNMVKNKRVEYEIVGNKYYYHLIAR